MKTASDIPWMVKAQSYIGVKGAVNLTINPLVVRFFREAEKKKAHDPDEPKYRENPRSVVRGVRGSHASRV